MKLLVTGGAGFIGSNFIKYIMRRRGDLEIVCLDKLTYAGDLASLYEVWDNSKFRFVKGDIADSGFIDALFEKETFDAVVNFAAESHVDRSIESSLDFLRSNVLGTGVLLDACVKYGNIRFHQVSTDEVYGDLSLERKDLAFCETSPLRPSSPYSSSKAGADLLTLSYYRTHCLPVTISRCGNNFGANQFPEKLIPLMIVKALNNENLPLYGNGLNVRDWIYVEDHCSAIETILYGGRAGEVYNVGANIERSNIDVVKTILTMLGSDEKLITYVKDRKGHDLRYALDTSKIRSKLGWTPTVGFEDGMDMTLRWYLDNVSWLNDITSGEYVENNERMLQKTARLK